MSMTDPIADMLTRIRNAMMVRHKEVEVPASKLKKALLQEEIDAAQTKADKEIQERIENAKKDRHHDNKHLDFQMQRLQEEEKAVARMQNKRRLEDGRAILADKRLEERKRRK